LDDLDPPFADRTDAGRQLAVRLLAEGLEQPLVYALPRGGVPLAAVVAQALAAPLELLLVRKIGAPGAPELALGAVVEGDPPQTVINEDVRSLSGADDAYLARVREREIDELRRRRALYLQGRPRLAPAGRTAVVVDDGLATGATARAALIALKRQGARKTVLAVPVAPVQTLADLATLADLVICLHPARRFDGVGAFYRDFHQLSDDETLALLRSAWGSQAAPDSAAPSGASSRAVAVPPLGLVGDLHVPADPRGLVVFAHGSGSSRSSPRNRAVAAALAARGFATLLLDLLTEVEARERRNVFDIPLLADRLAEVALWKSSEPDIAGLPLGLFGASTGAGAALLAAARLRQAVAAVVSRGGWPDLAHVHAPTLLIVGGEDHEVLALNRHALSRLPREKRLEIVPGATHLFEEPGALESVARLAGNWFERHLAQAVPLAARTSLAAMPRPDSAVLRAAARPLPRPEDAEFAVAFDRFAQARVVLLGEATHGTAEFYRARAAITRRLIERHGYSFVAVEADWPDAAAIDRHARRLPQLATSSAPFSRFPTWMWRNREVDDFVRALRDHNATRAPGSQVGFYGLDLYNMSASMAAVLVYLDRVDPQAAASARQRYACLAPWSREPAAYGRAALSEGVATCEKPVLRILVDLMQNELRYTPRDGAGWLDATQNARLVANAERYYRVMYYGSHESWNLRDRHMFDTLKNVLHWSGPDAKAVVWAHNSHIGDARYTEMGSERGELNLGQLCRQHFGASAALIGFGTHTGTVAAASEWDGPMEVMAVRPSCPGSYELLCHEAGIERGLLDLRAGHDEGLRRVLLQPRLERYIGVIYRPDTERWSHYAQATLAEQYDAFVWLDQTRAVTPLPGESRAGEDETYPFGL
jgi:putative phosphoribosyl transferase